MTQFFEKNIFGKELIIVINYGILLETIDSSASIFWDWKGGYEMAEKKDSVKKNQHIVVIKYTKTLYIEDFLLSCYT